MFDTNGLRGPRCEIGQLASERALYIGDPAPEPLALKLKKAEVAVERGGVLIARIHDHCTCPEFARAPHAAPKCVNENIAAEARPALSAIKRKPRQKDDRHRVWHPTPKPSWRIDMGDRAHRERVVADDSLASAQHIRGGGPGRGRGAR